MAISNSSSSRSSSATGRASSSAVSLAFGRGLSPVRLRCLLDRVDAEGHSADGQHVAGLEALLPEDSLAVDERPVGAAQIAEHEPVAVLEELAVAAAHLGGADPDQAVVVAADAVDSVDQLERVGFAAAADDLENIVHGLGNPGWLAGRSARG